MGGSVDKLARRAMTVARDVLLAGTKSHHAHLQGQSAPVKGHHARRAAHPNWPSVFARRLAQLKGHAPTAIINAGIAGNRLLSDGFGIKALGVSALARFDRDVLTLPGATHVVLLEGVNDIGFPGATLGGQALAGPGETRTVADVIGAYQQLIARAHARGLKIIGATMTPFERVDLPQQVDTVYMRASTYSQLK